MHPISTVWTDQDCPDWSVSPWKSDPYVLMGCSDRAYPSWMEGFSSTDHGLSGLVPSVREKCPVRTDMLIRSAISTVWTDQDCPDWSISPWKSDPYVLMGWSDRAYPSWMEGFSSTDHGLSGLVPSVREKCPVRTARQSHVGQNHPRTAKTTRETKNSKINIFEENFLKGNIRNMSIKSLGCQVLIKSSFRHPLRPRQPEPCSMQKTWLEASENYENLPENSFNHPYEACKKSDSNSKYFFFYIKNTPGTESMSTGGRLKKSDLYI